MFAVSEWHKNVADADSQKMADEFGAKYNRDFFFYRLGTAFAMLAQGMNEAKSTDPKLVALKLESMTYKTTLGETFVRASDHQFYQPLYVSVMADDVSRKLEKTTVRVQDRRRILGQGHRGSDDLPDASAVTETPRDGSASALPSPHFARATVLLEQLAISTLNGLIYGMLLFMLRAG